ncbi:MULTISPECIES: MFS transporter [Pseudomonas]|jgi:ACS family tartrate transporter-like MFS transporter|uniref:Membrane protein n=1 Tax=Pseudomonas putida S13.1.2 TaxID=1384061 RepID=A0AAU8S901_PSEPU|nr:MULTISPECIES: MFS transporter [Pseudomonas]AJQ46243.1 membrane protein [Pseudomonas putida S13.1.2]TCP78609.1 ACS family tartrate transporter-like MFS transporter [Pseudomonas putida]UVL76801.1 MFS transporter [Pseudomonas putida]
MNNNKTVDEQAVVRKVTLRIIPFMFLLYIVSYLDRANIGYAALEMNKELALTSEAFGFISGIFFIGYFLFEVPSNVMLNKYGARVWIARILVTWGLIAAATAFAQTANQLYVLRFFLGVAEAGFFPGVIVYLTYWFRSKELATTVALFTAAIPVSYIIGAPLSTWIMDNIKWLDWSGWRWMLFLEGVPAVFLGIACFLFLTDKPEQAKWLTQQEKDWLLAELERDRQSRKNVKRLGVFKTMVNKKVLYLAFIYFVYQCGSLGVGYWMPQIIKGFSSELTHTQIGLIAMLPYIVATVAMVIWSRSSDRRNERKMHSAIPLAVAALGLVGAGMLSSPVASMAMICVALSGLYSFKSPFWALPTLFLDRATAAVSIAVINSIGNLGGFVGPSMIGVVKGNSQSAATGLLFLSALLLIAFLMTALMRVTNKEPDQPVAASAH